MARASTARAGNAARTSRNRNNAEPSVVLPAGRCGLHIVGGRGSHMRRPGSPPSAEQLRLARARVVFLDLVRQGVTIHSAARTAGVCHKTINGWRRTDAAFDAEVREAIEFGNASLEDRILKHSINDWRAADRLLQVRDPERWGPKRASDVAVNVSLANVPEVELRRRVQELELKLLGRVITPDDEPLPGMTVEGRLAE